jgi:hypothetical protein
MIDYVLFFSEANAAKQRLARLFPPQGLVPGKQLSATVVAANSSYADLIAIKQTTEAKKISRWQKQSFRRQSRYHEDRAVVERRPMRASRLSDVIWKIFFYFS